MGANFDLNHVSLLLNQFSKFLCQTFAFWIRTAKRYLWGQFCGTPCNIISLNVKKVTKTDEETSPYIWEGSEEENDFYFVCGYGNHCDEFKQKLKVSVKEECTTDDTRPGMNCTFFSCHYLSRFV